MLSIDFGSTFTGTDWSDTIELTDDDDNSLVDLTGATLRMSVIDPDGCVSFSGSTSDGALQVLGLGTFDFQFLNIGVDAGDYTVRATIERDGIEVPLLVGTKTFSEGL